MTVYFVRFEDRGRWKIGYTDGTAAQRATGLTFTPCQFWIEAEIEGSQGLEQQIHRRFARQRVDLPGRKEIFETSPELERFVAYAKAFGTIDGFDEYSKGDLSVARRTWAKRSRRVAAIADNARSMVGQVDPSIEAFRAGEAPWFVAHLEKTIWDAWGRAGHELGLTFIDSLPVKYDLWPHPSGHQAGPFWADTSASPGYQVGSRITPRLAIDWLRSAAGWKQFSIAWVGLAAFEAHRSMEWRERCGVESLEHMAELAAMRLGRFPVFHHSSPQVFPERFYGLLATETHGAHMPVASFVHLARIHAHFTLSRHRATEEFLVGAVSDVTNREVTRVEWLRAA